MRVLILSCNTGGGHNSCAEAIQEAFIAYGDVCDIADSLSFSSDGFSRFMAWGHTTMYRHIPGLFRAGYGFVESHVEMLREGAPAHKLLTSGTKQLSDFLRDGNYDTVICTHVFSGILLTAAMKEFDLSLNTAFVATDYTCSPGTAKSDLDLYFIPGEELMDEFAERGVPGDRLVVSGMPIRRCFYQKQDKAAAKEFWGIDPNHAHLLLMGGSIGCGPIEELTEQLSSRLNESCEISVVCATNEKLYKSLSKTYADDPKIHIHEFVRDMSSLMDSADLYLTKPGGLSTSEAYAKELPMVFIDAVAGCEAYNLRYFLNLGGAVTAPTVPELTELCIRLLENRDLRGEMETALVEKGHKNSADLICSRMHARMKEGAQ